METRYFRFVEVAPETPEYETYLALRYEVFCAELHRIEEFSKTSGDRRIETDRFDPVSRHWLATHLETGMPAACCRLILPNPYGLSIARRYEIEDYPYPGARADATAEISRMAIAPEFRRRHSDQGKPVEGDPNEELPDRAPEEKGRRHQPELVLGMYREIFLLAGEIGMTHAYAAMASNYSRILLMAGFPFIAVGPMNRAVEPPRRPYIVSRDDIIERLGIKNPGLLAFLHGEREDLRPRTAATACTTEDIPSCL